MRNKCIKNLVHDSSLKKKNNAVERTEGSITQGINYFKLILHLSLRRCSFSYSGDKLDNLCSNLTFFTILEFQKIKIKLRYIYNPISLTPYKVIKLFIL